MFCQNCGANIQDGSKFCSACGAAIAQSTCPGCGNPVKPEASFCPVCGRTLKSGAQSQKPAPAQPPPAMPGGITSDLKDLSPGEVVLMDTGAFPISYVKNMMTSINGKLHLTNQRLVFKASVLQGVGGVAEGGLFIPNPVDANKAKQYFAIPLNQITSVESGWANVTVEAGGQKYKFGGMRKTGEWVESIKRAMGA